MVLSQISTLHLKCSCHVTASKETKVVKVETTYLPISLCMRITWLKKLAASIRPKAGPMVFNVVILLPVVTACQVKVVSLNRTIQSTELTNTDQSMDQSTWWTKSFREVQLPAVWMLLQNSSTILVVSSKTKLVLWILTTLSPSSDSELRMELITGLAETVGVQLGVNKDISELSEE